jgi:hypothetical protein
MPVICPHCQKSIPPVLARADRAHLGRLLPAIGGVFGSDLFVVSELVEAAQPALRLVCAGLSTKQLGRLLLRASKHPQGIDGYHVQACGVEVGATLWCVKVS